MLNMSAVTLTKTPIKSQDTKVLLKNNVESNLQSWFINKLIRIFYNLNIAYSCITDKKDNLVEKLVNKLPELNQYFTVHKKIGEGTFSNVFVASSKVFAEKKKFAIKHLIPTSHPTRIIQELRCLKDIGYVDSWFFIITNWYINLICYCECSGRDNVVGLELCLRNKDTVAFVMPYFPHDSFSVRMIKSYVIISRYLLKSLFHL